MAIPVERALFPPVAATDPVVVPIGVPPRGRIRRFRVLALNAPAGAVSYTLYSSKNAFVLDASNAPTGVLAANSELYRIMPDMTVAQGVLITPAGFDLDYSYENLDGGNTNRGYLVYLRLIGYGAGNSIAVSVVTESDSLT